MSNICIVPSGYRKYTTIPKILIYLAKYLINLINVIVSNI